MLLRGDHFGTMHATTLRSRALVRLSGDDVTGFLQGLVTNDIAALSDGEPCWAGLLSPQGKALFDFSVWRTGDDLSLDCEADHADELIKRLSIYRLRRKIIIERDAGLVVHWSPGTEDQTSDPRLVELGYRWLAPLTDSYGDDAWREHRLSLGVPEGRAELGYDRILWLETNAIELNGVSFSKGCYVGQENTARMNWRAKVNRRLVVVPIAASDEKRRMMAYPDIGLAVDHRGVEDLAGFDLPGWQVAALGSVKITTD